MTNGNNPNNTKSGHDRLGLLKVLRKNIVLRALLVVFIVVLTIVLLFSLTAAWFTNVTQTGGLTFTAEQWNFNGTIILDDAAVKAAPGDQGTVSMQLRNEGETLVAASVTVSKEEMDERMKNRMYFYIDTAMVRNNEYMERVWVSSTAGYTYTIFPGGQLFMNEAAQNVPALKWMWVYDVLGYYVKGTQTDSGSVEVSEYIRPIEYDYDEINTTFDEEGNLVTIDGQTSAAEFLLELTETDGYAGVIDGQTSPIDGYYPIDIDENGYGVWLYLCTYDEIAANTEIDTALGSGAAVASTAHITVSGRNSNEEAKEVDDLTELMLALNYPSSGVIKLTNDLTLSEPLVLTESAYAMIDLGGHTITSTAASVITADAGAQLTLMNGSLVGSSTNVIYSSGAHISLSDVTISGAVEGIEIRDCQNERNADSVIYITDSTITGIDDAVFLQANGENSTRKTSVIIENSTLTGTGYAGIYCKGNLNESGSDVQVNNCKVTGHHAGIYFPQADSTLTVTNSEVVGNIGVVAKGGIVNLIDCTIQGIGAHSEPAVNMSGWENTGDGVYLDASYEGRTTTVVISGDQTNISSLAEGSAAVRRFDPDPSNSSLTVMGGTYSSDISAYLADGVSCTYNGTNYTVTAVGN